MEGLVDLLAAHRPGHVHHRLEIGRVGGAGHRRLLGHAGDEAVQIGESELTGDRGVIAGERRRRMDRRDLLPGVGLGQQEGLELDGAVDVVGQRAGECVAERDRHRVDQARIDGLTGGHHAGRVHGGRGDDGCRIGERAGLAVGADQRHHAGRRSAEADAQQHQGQECTDRDGDDGEGRPLTESRNLAPGQLGGGHVDAGTSLVPGGRGGATGPSVAADGSGGPALG